MCLVNWRKVLSFLCASIEHVPKEIRKLYNKATGSNTARPNTVTTEMSGGGGRGGGLGGKVMRD